MSTHKDELIQLHSLLCHVKTGFERATGRYGAFTRYEDLGVSPTHVHKSKSEHKRAVFILGAELAAALADTPYSGAAQVSHRLAKMAARVERTMIGTIQ